MPYVNLEEIKFDESSVGQIIPFDKVVFDEEKQSFSVKDVLPYLKEYYDYLHTPTESPKSIGDFLTRVIPGSISKTAVGLAEFPFVAAGQISEGFNKALARVTSDQGDLLTSLQEAGRETTKPIIEIGKGIAQFVGEPLGFYGDPRAIERWLTDPAGSLLAVAPVAGKMMEGSFSRVLNKLPKDQKVKFAEVVKKEAEVTGKKLDEIVHEAKQTVEPPGTIPLEEVKFDEIAPTKAVPPGATSGGITVYRGGTPIDSTQITDRGISTTTSKEVAARFKTIVNEHYDNLDNLGLTDIVGQKERYGLHQFVISPEAKIATKTDIPIDIYNQYKKANPFLHPDVAEPILGKWAKENGFDAIDYRTLGKTSAKEAEIKILNPSVLKDYPELSPSPLPEVGASGGKQTLTKVNEVIEGKYVWQNTVESVPRDTVDLLENAGQFFTEKFGKNELSKTGRYGTNLLTRETAPYATGGAGGAKFGVTNRGEGIHDTWAKTNGLDFVPDSADAWNVHNAYHEWLHSKMKGASEEIIQKKVVKATQDYFKQSPSPLPTATPGGKQFIEPESVYKDIRANEGIEAETLARGLNQNGFITIDTHVRGEKIIMQVAADEATLGRLSDTGISVDRVPIVEKGIDESYRIIVPKDQVERVLQELLPGAPSVLKDYPELGMEIPEAELKINPLDDPNTLLDMAAAQDIALGTGDIGDNPTFDAIRGEAARLAWAKINKKINFAERKQEATIKRQTLEDARQDPVHQLMEEVKRGGGFNYDKLREDYDKDTIKELMRKRPGLISKSGKWLLDEAAVDSGIWESDTDLMNAMIDYKGLKESARSFEANYHKLLSEVEVQDYYIDILAEEAKILRRLLKGNAPKAATGLKKVIREETGQVRVGELVVSGYDALKAGMKKAEQASRKAFSVGKYEGALKEKERAHEVALRLRARLEAKEEVNKIRDQLTRLSELKNIPEDYRDRIDDLLSEYDFKPRSTRIGKKVESQREFLERQEAAGEDVNLPRALLDRIERYGRKHWKELNLDELRSIRDQVVMLAHLGKLKGELISKNNKRNFESAVSTVLDTIKANWPEVVGHDVETMLLDPTMMERGKEYVAKYGAELIKPEMIFRRLDKWKDLGAIWELGYKPVKTSSDTEITNFFEIISNLQKVFEPFTKGGKGYKWLKEKYKIEGIPQILTKEKMIGVALNTGNEGNLDVLRYGMKWDDAQIKTITGKLSPEEWQLVRDVWKMYDDQFPALAEVYKALTGTTLEKVEGNYHPIKWDKGLAWFVDKDASTSEAKDLFANMFPSLKVESSFTIARQGGVPFPPNLSLDVVFNHLSDVNHYTSHALAIRDVQKLLKDPRVKVAIEGAPVGGTPAYQQLIPWLQEIARPERDLFSATESLLKTLRRNTTVVGLGLKFVTALVQWESFGNSAVQVGGGELAKGILEFYSHPLDMIKKIKSQSPEMGVRMHYWDRELKDAYGRLGLENFFHSQTIKDSYFGLISMMDLLLAYPTWTAGFNKGMEDFRGDESQAKEFADMSVRIAQGTAMPKDLAAIQRGSELKKFVTMFYTFFSAMHNQMTEIQTQFKTGEKNVVDLFKAWWWVILAPVMIDHIMRERQMPSIGEIFSKAVQFRLGGYPVVRDLASPVFSDYDYQFSPVVRAGEVISKTGSQMANLVKGEPDFDKLFRYGFESSGYIFGLPTGQAIITIQGFNDLKNGDTNDLTRLLLREPRYEEE